MNDPAPRLDLTYEEFVIELFWDGKERLGARHGDLERAGSPKDLRAAISAGTEAELGRLIDEILLPGDIGTAFDEASRRVATDAAAGLRLVIVLPRPASVVEGEPKTSDVPWEAVRHRSDLPLVARRKVSIVRRWNDQRTVPELFNGEGRIVQLFDASMLEGREIQADFPEVERKEWERIGALHSVRDPTFRDVESLTNQRIAVFHFTGHGESDALRINGPRVHAGAAIKALSDTRLAVLSACDTATTATTTRFPHPGIAGELADTVPAVLGMSRQVQDTEAATFHRELYRLLRAGASLDEAVRSARLVLMEEHPPDRPLVYAIPVLYLGVTGGTRLTAPSTPTMRSEPLALARSRSGETLVGFESTGRGGVRRVRSEDAGESPATISANGTAAAAASGDSISLGSIFSYGDDVHLEQQRIPLPGELSDARVLAVSRRYGSSDVFDFVMATDTHTVQVSRQSRWHASRSLDHASAVTGAVFTPTGALVIHDAQSFYPPDDQPGPFSITRIVGCDVACSGNEWVALAWGTDRKGSALVELRRWDERAGTRESPSWKALELPDGTANGVVTAGIVRELEPGAAPRTIAIQRGDSIELIDIPGIRAGSPPGRQ